MTKLRIVSCTAP